MKKQISHSSEIFQIIQAASTESSSSAADNKSSDEKRSGERSIVDIQRHRVEVATMTKSDDDKINFTGIERTMTTKV